MTTRRLGPGGPEPLGVTLVAGGANVAVYSAHATAIEFCLFDAAGNSEVERIALPERTGNVFHGHIAGVESGQRYGLRAHGPWDPREGHRFNAAKLLVDPYARALDRRFALHPSLFDQNPDSTTRNHDDSAPHMPKAILLPVFTHASTRPPDTSWPRTILYELHVRGFTQSHPAVPAALRGTCAGLAHPAALAHLVRMGVTAVELMPLAAAVDDWHLGPLGLTNYWGYNPAALMVPDPRLAPGGMAELAACVDAFHDAGLEVLLDVVLNHTGEGDARGPTVSLRGLDNATYYRLIEGDRAAYVDDAGCGNTLALDRPPVLRLAMDTLRYFVTAAGVDGFRFDLATTLARRGGNFDPAAPLLTAIGQDPLLRDLKLVAEPWDIGTGGYRLGAFPAGWGEWNDQYRDTVRRFWRGDAGMVGELATRLSGSADIFAAGRRRPSCSVNFIAAHDGFTLSDLVSYGSKRNDANGESNRDGVNENLSWNHGIDGPVADDAVGEARRRDVRSLLATLLVSRGTPMLAMGDELGRTQLGNNNAYSQDSALTWIDWAAADHSLIEFVGKLATLRHTHPALNANRWLRGEPVDSSGVPDVEWRHADGHAMTAQDWAHPAGRVLIAAFYAAATDAHPADRVAVAFNAGGDAVSVRWPDARDAFVWRRVIDTAAVTVSSPVPGDTIGPRSVVVLVEAEAPRAAAGSSGIEPAVLDRLARAAGIASDWTDVAGARHVVTSDTCRAVLAGMGLGAATTGQARERLFELATQRDRRPLPRTLVVYGGRPARIALTLSAGPLAARAMLHIETGQGQSRYVPIAFDALPVEAISAVDGSIVRRCLLALPDLPVGTYRVFRDDAPDAPCQLVVAPQRCHLPEELRAGELRFGLAAHLYSLRRPGDQGIGDFTTLQDAAHATARAGGVIVGLNPLHALFPATRERASPYHPSDRRFLDPIYIDVERVPELEASDQARRVLGDHAAAFGRLAHCTDVDYAGVWQAKHAVLAACFDAFERRGSDDNLTAEFDRFVDAGGDALMRFATFEAIAAANPQVPWPQWPAALRQPDAPAVALFAQRHARGVRFALYLQWLADRQLGDAAASAAASGLSIGFCRDLAVGAAPDGAESWSTQSVLARGVSIGAPPDPFAAGGQVWQLPPPIPDAIHAEGYANFRALLRANTRHAGALRIDHVMGLARLYWIPDGAAAGEGAYVHYPLDELLGVLAQESVRASCAIIGEDLGTVPEGFRERLGDADVLSYQPLWFQRDGVAFRAPDRYAAKALACISTHDLPTIKGWWDGIDIDERRALHLYDEGGARRARAERQVDKEALVTALVAAGCAAPDAIDPQLPHNAAVTQAIHRFLGATPSALVLAQADDLAEESMALNLPGTDRERPNWRRRIGVAAAQLWHTAAGMGASADFAHARARPERDGAPDS